MMEGPICSIWDHPTQQKQLMTIFAIISKYKLHAGTQESNTTGTELQPGRGENREKYGLNERQSERGRNPGASFLSLSAPCLPHPPSLLHPWDVDASRGQLPTDTSSWTVRQALTALVQTNDAGVEVAGPALSLPGSSPPAWPCAALANHTQMKKKSYIKDSSPPTTSSFRKNTFISSWGMVGEAERDLGVGVGGCSTVHLRLFPLR